MLFGKARMVARVPIMGSENLDLVFNLEGLEQALAPIRGACGW